MGQTTTRYAVVICDHEGKPMGLAGIKFSRLTCAIACARETVDLRSRRGEDCGAMVLETPTGVCVWQLRA